MSALETAINQVTEQIQYYQQRINETDASYVNSYITEKEWARNRAYFEGKASGLQDAVGILTQLKVAEAAAARLNKRSDS